MRKSLGSACAFDRELFVGGVGGVKGVGDFDIKGKREGIVEGFVSVSLTDIVLVMCWLR